MTVVCDGGQCTLTAGPPMFDVSLSLGGVANHILCLTHLAPQSSCGQLRAMLLALSLAGFGLSAYVYSCSLNCKVSSALCCFGSAGGCQDRFVSCVWHSGCISP